jgi:hypothetical protein
MTSTLDASGVMPQPGFESLRQQRGTATLVHADAAEVLDGAVGGRRITLA